MPKVYVTKSRLDRTASPYYTWKMSPLSALLLLAPAALAAAPNPPAAGRLVKAQGDVTIESPSGGRLGKDGAALAEGDAVSTAEGATALVELADGSRLKLRESSRLRIVVSGKSAELNLALGSVFAKVRKRLAGENFLVRTPSAVAAVRGTEFFTAYGRPRGKDRDLWVCVNEGAVELTTTKDKKPLLVPGGQGVLIKGGKDLTQPQAYDWTKTLNWNMDESGALEDATKLDKAYSDLLDQDYR